MLTTFHGLVLALCLCRFDGEHEASRSEELVPGPGAVCRPGRVSQSVLPADGFADIEQYAWVEFGWDLRYVCNR